MPRAKPTSRRVIRERLQAGSTPDDIILYFETRFGPKVRAELPREGFNLVLFGWVGGALFFLGLAGLLLQSLRFAETKRDPYAGTFRACAVALISILPIGEVFTGSSGTLLWSMIGLGLSAHAYHQTTGLALRSRAWEAARARSALPGMKPGMMPFPMSPAAPVPMPTPVSPVRR